MRDCPESETTGVKAEITFSDVMTRLTEFSENCNKKLDDLLHTLRKATVKNKSDLDENPSGDVL